MSSDILKEYFSKQEAPIPKVDFEKRLIESLHARIIKLERRKEITSVALVVASALALLAVLLYFLPLATIAESFKAIEFAIEYSPLTLQAMVLTIVLLIGQYILDERELKKLRKRLKIDAN
ncbi:MAG: hypothetical protein SNG38_06550 [Rikenellaceae bacterium]